MAEQKLLLTKLKSKSVDSYVNSLKFPSVEIIHNISYNDDGQVLDIHLPKERAGKLGVFVNFHGGFFLYGHRQRRKGYCSYLADKGFAVINVGYGLAPKYSFPDQTRQGCLALKWIEENANKYDLDLDRVAVGGDGIGAYLACQIVVANINSEYRKKLDTVGVNFRIKGTVFFRGIFDMHLMLSVSPYSRRKQDLVLRQIMGKNREIIEENQYYNLISPIRFITEDFPDTYLAYDVEDKMRSEQAARLKNLLDRYGIPKWEFRSVYGNFVRTGGDEKKHPRDVMACIEISARFLKKIFTESIKIDETFEI